MKFAIAFAALLSLGAASEDAPSIQGDYVEARTCDVWTGPCFSNSEIHLRGKNAVVGWSVGKGSWNGAPLDGLKVVAALNAEGTLHTETEGKVEAVLFVDERASETQTRALVSMARALAPKHLANIVRVERAPISYSRKGLEASLVAGSAVKLKTSAFCPCDSICCNEEQAYPAVSLSSRVECARTLDNAYEGKALGVQWSDPVRRSAMVGTFLLRSSRP